MTFFFGGGSWEWGWGWDVSGWVSSDSEGGVFLCGYLYLLGMPGHLGLIERV